MLTNRRLFPASILRLLFLAGLLSGSLLLVQGQASAQAENGTGSCQGRQPQQEKVTGITLPGDPTGQYTVYGWLCNPLSGPSRTVQLLVHGATYDHTYWDWPAIPGHPDWPARYSAVQFLAAAGDSTFNIDRIGIGQSDHPNSSLIDLNANASVVHQIVGRLKSGAIGGIKFASVVLEGHSVGSAVSVIEASTYHDVAGVVVTGLLQHESLSFLAGVKTVTAQSEAQRDPKDYSRFANLDSGYLTTTPNTRAADFYYDPPTYSDPAVIQYDEQTKQTMTQGELNDIIGPGNGSLSFSPININVPVLDIVGQHDALFCEADAVNCSSNATVYQEEAPFYSPQAQLQVNVIPNTGHDLNLHFTAQTTYGIIATWLRLHKCGPN